MRRKFSFDLPRLKIGPLKSDPKVNKNTGYTSPIDSPVEAPKSVRPPLPPHLEADLRAACAYVLQNFKPSHQIYTERYGAHQKPQLDYGAIKAGAKRDGLAVEGGAVGTLSKVNTNVDSDASQDAFDPERLRYKPEVKTEDLFKHEQDPREQFARSARARAEQLMGGAAPAPEPKTSSERPASAAHRRSQSTPQPTSKPSQQKSDVLIRPHNVPRADSTDTTGSTPFTDSTDYPHSHHSTAPTSAAVTPARSSKRTSAQAFQVEHESNSVPKVDSVDAEWMRKELMKHKAAQEEESRKAAQVATATSVGAVPASYSRLPTRKPVASSRASKEASRPASRQTKDSSRTDSRPSESTTRPSTASGRETQQQQLRHERERSIAQPTGANVPPTERERGRSRASSVTRGVIRYFRPESAHNRQQSRPRAESRARSITREVKDYFRPGTANGSRKPSMDIQRNQTMDPSGTQTRSESTESYHSALSGQPKPTRSGSRKWRSHRPWPTSRADSNNDDENRPGSSSSHARGPHVDHNDDPASPRRGRRSINLNRELPPLPSLDSWKVKPLQVPPPQAAYEKPRVRSMQPEDVVAMYESSRTPSPGPQIIEQSRSPHLQVPHGLQHDLGAKTSTDTLDVHDSDNGLSQTPSYDPTPLAPTTTIEPPGWGKQPKLSRRRSRSIQGAHPPLSGVGYRNTAAKDGSGHQSPVANSPRSTPPNYSRPSGPNLKGLRKKMNLGSDVTKNESNQSYSHSRDTSQQQLPYRKASSDNDFYRMHDPRYRNIVEISATASGAPQQPHHYREKSRKHWWQGKEKKDGDWMQKVANSGSRSGIMLTDDVAGAPIVRY